MGLEDFLNNDDMQINKNIDTVSSTVVPELKSSLMDLIGEKKKVKKHTVSTYLKDETFNKMKTLCAQKNISMSSAIESILIELTKEVEIDSKMIKKYNKTKTGRK